jgi:membrane dipeptidase
VIDGDRVDVARRKLMLGAAAIPVVAATGLPAVVRAAAVDPFDQMIVVNGLGGISSNDAEPSGADKAPAEKLAGVIGGTFPSMVTDQSVDDARVAGLTAVNVTVGHVDGDVDPYELTVADIGRWNRIIATRGKDLLRVAAASDIRRAKAENKIGIIYGTQNTSMLGDQAERVEVLADLGMRIVQLTYNKANSVGDGCLAPENRGLSAFGHEVVERLDASRMLIDLSHSGQRTCLDTIRAAKRPVALTHTGCRALADLPRNKSDEELRLLADRGGYVGIYFMRFLVLEGAAKAADVVRHIDHAINVCGEDHVGIGTDSSSSPVPDMAAYLKSLAEYIEQRKKAGISAPGESATSPIFVVDLVGPRQFRDLERLLRAKGYHSTRIEKVFGGNFLRVAAEVWGA